MKVFLAIVFVFGCVLMETTSADNFGAFLVACSMVVFMFYHHDVQVEQEKEDQIEAISEGIARYKEKRRKKQ